MRCESITALTAVVFFSLQQAVLISTPCFYSDSFGNWLSNYFETILCARAAHMHYMAVAKVWEPSVNDSPSALVSRLPSTIQHDNPVSKYVAADIIEKRCPCSGNCHMRPNGLWTKGLSVIRPLLWDALNHHYLTLPRPSTAVLSSDLSTSAVGTTLPFIPEVAIHYRCGDNFVGHYGFLPFSAFNKYVPAAAKTIYVLADKRGRKTDRKKHRAVMCDAIFSALFAYLAAAFPTASVVVRRGDDLYMDLLRLAYAPVTICSVSTFCLWPALANNRTAYFPRTKLVVQGDTPTNLGLQWITQPAVVPGARHERASTAKLIHLLSTAI